MAQQLLLLLPAPSRTFLKPLPSPFLSSLPRRHLVPVSAVRMAPAIRRGLLRYATKRSGLVEELEIAKDMQPRSRRANGIFWILLLNFGIYVADHLFQIRQIKSLYLYHAFPTWFQFVTSTFCHANWNHLSSNLFFVYIFGKLVEEEEGNFALWMSYILTGAGANLISWLVLPTSSVSLGASGAVFGLFTISVLVKMSWDWRKILEVLILGQFVVDKVMEAARATTITGQSFQVNNIAHVSDPCYAAFHDQEWGVPVHDDKKLFEMLTLSGALAEMAWPAILSKRDTFREVFMNFDPQLVAELNEKKFLAPSSPASSLLSQHRLRIIIENARELLKVIDEFGSFDSYCWSFMSNKPMVGGYRHTREVPLRTAKADAISQDLMRRGFLGVGPTVVIKRRD